MGQHRVYIDMGDLGEQLCNVFYEYQPYEHATLEYPGCEESVDIYKVMWNNYDITDLLSSNRVEYLREEVLNSFEEVFE